MHVKVFDVGVVGFLVIMGAETGETLVV